MKFTKPLVKAFMIAPLNIMIVIPAILCWVSMKWELLQPFHFKYSPVSEVAGLICLAFGFYIVCRSVADLTSKGEDGTPAPWHPPTKLCVTGIYSWTRNPLITGVAFVLLGEAILCGTTLNFGWFLFWAGSFAVMTPLMEEPELEEKFGAAWLKYKKSVPRWLPGAAPQKNHKDQSCL
jgi:protein-S-isoprenylcysteine O-methyltransferase Ste14